MADIKLSPQSDDPQDEDNGKDDDPTGSYKFDDSDEEKTSADSDSEDLEIKPSGESTSDDSHTPASDPEAAAAPEGLLGASTDDAAEEAPKVELEAEPESEPDPEVAPVPAPKPESEPAEKEPAEAEEKEGPEPVEEEPEPEPEPGENTPDESPEESSPSTPEQTQEETPDETSEDSEDDTPSVLDEEPHKGISKPLLFGGIILLIGIVGAGVYFGRGIFFKGQVAPELVQDLRDSADVVQLTCDINEYYDPGTESTVITPLPGRDLTEEVVQPGIDPIPPVEETRFMNSLDMYKAQLINNSMLDAVQVTNPGDTTSEEVITIPGAVGAPEEETLTVTEATTLLDNLDIAPAETIPQDENADTITDVPLEEALPEASAESLTVVPEEVPGVSFNAEQCQPIPQDDCELLRKLQENPTNYFLHPDTLPNLAGWLESCAEPLVAIDAVRTVDECGSNQEVVDGACQCIDGYFDIGDTDIPEKEASATDALLDATRDTLTADEAAAAAETRSLPGSDVLTITPETPVDLDADGNPIGADIVELDADGNPIRDTSDNTRLIDNISVIDETRTLSTLDDSDDILSELAVRETESTLTCVDCEMLIELIDRKKAMLPAEAPTRIGAAPSLSLETDRAEIERLERIADEQGCRPSCTGDHMIAAADGTCVCEAHYQMNEQGECEFDCDEVVATIQQINEAPAALATEDTTVELANLENLAEQNLCVVEEEELTPCEEYLAATTDLLDRGDVRGSYDNQVLMVRAECLREYNTCEENLAIARLAQEYLAIAGEISPDSVRYFEAQENQYLNSYYMSSACTDLDELCEETASGLGQEAPEEETAEPRLDLLTVDSGPVAPEVLTIDTIQTKQVVEPSLLSQETLQNNINEFIDARGLVSEIDISSFLNEYCDGVPYVGEGILPEEEPADPPVSPAAPPPSPPPGGGSGSAVSPPPSDSGSSSGPVAGGMEIIPIAPETEAAESDEPVVFTATTTAEAPEGESAVDDLRPAAGDIPPAAPEYPEEPAEPELVTDIPEDEFELTVETAPPDIYPVGPEVLVYIFGILTAQAYIFRRKIFAYISNK